MLVIAHPPQDAEHDETQRDLDELRRIDGDHGVRIHPDGKLDAEVMAHVPHGGGRRPIWEFDGEKPAWPRLAVVVADGPATGATDRVRRRDCGRADIEDSQH